MMSSYLIILAMLVAFGLTVRAAKTILVRRKREEMKATGETTGQIKRLNTVFNGRHQAPTKILLKVFAVAALAALGTGVALALVLAAVGKGPALFKEKATEQAERTKVTVIVIEEDDDGGEETKQFTVVDAGVEVDAKTQKPDAKAQVAAMATAPVVPSKRPETPMASPRKAPIQVTAMRPSLRKLMPSIKKTCGRGKVVHVRKGRIRCLSPGSKAAQFLIKRGLRQRLRKVIQQNALPKTQKIMKQSVLAAPVNLGKDVAKRGSILDKLAEVLYFLLTLGGVVARFWWDHALEKRKALVHGLKSETFQFHNLILAPFLAIAVHLVLTKSMSGAYQSLQFQGTLLAVYNGFVWPVLIKDISEFKNIRHMKAGDNGKGNDKVQGADGR